MTDAGNCLHLDIASPSSVSPILVMKTWRSPHMCLKCDASHSKWGHVLSWGGYLGILEMQEMCMIFNIVIYSRWGRITPQRRNQDFPFFLSVNIQGLDEHHHAYESVCILVNVYAKSCLVLLIRYYRKVEPLFNPTWRVMIWDHHV